MVTRFMVASRFNGLLQAFQASLPALKEPAPLFCCRCAGTRGVARQQRPGDLLPVLPEGSGTAPVGRSAWL